jgi:hypothetical protein
MKIKNLKLEDYELVYPSQLVRDDIIIHNGNPVIIKNIYQGCGAGSWFFGEYWGIVFYRERTGIACIDERISREDDWIYEKQPIIRIKRNVLDN